MEKVLGILHLFEKGDDPVMILFIEFLILNLAASTYILLFFDLIFQ